MSSFTIYYALRALSLICLIEFEKAGYGWIGDRCSQCVLPQLPKAGRLWRDASCLVRASLLASRLWPRQVPSPVSCCFRCSFSLQLLWLRRFGWYRVLSVALEPYITYNFVALAMVGVGSCVSSGRCWAWRGWTACWLTAGLCVRLWARVASLAGAASREDPQTHNEPQLMLVKSASAT